jgi:hypothetical protein
MRQVGPDCRTADKRWWQESPFVWFAIVAAVTALLLLAVATAVSFGVYHLPPNNEPFIPYFTT